MEPRADLILANRAYVDHMARPGLADVSRPAEGGLLAAVRPAIRAWDGTSGTTWIGASRGTHDREWADASGYELIDTPRGLLRHRRLFFAVPTWDAHYGGVANGFLWPLLHLVGEPLPERAPYYPLPATPSDEQWASYARVNRCFAEAAIEEGREQGTCWVQDYQLGLVPGMLRENASKGCIGFFLHTPFPDLEVARPYLNERGIGMFREFVRGIAGADLAGFQTAGDAGRFEQAAAALLGATASEGGIRVGERLVKTGVFPVGVDADELLAVARSAPRSPRSQAARSLGVPLVVGLERADYTKGIPERLRAVAAAYRDGARFAYAGIDAPTREGVRSYDAVEPAIRAAAAEARTAAEAAGMPFSQSREIAPWEEVVALQRDADVVFTSSLADGMNLVPLQTAVVQSLRPLGERAVILAGKSAGVAGTFAGFERDGLQIIDPFDGQAMVRALEEALRGQPGRVSDRFVAAVQAHDARSWATGFLEELNRSC